MNVLKDNTLKIFVTYAVPSVLGMLAIASSAIVDGFFIGNYVGSAGLASINISMPIFSILFGIAFMFAIGSSVLAGKLIGEGDLHSASNIFTKTIISMSIIGFILCFLFYINIDNILSFYETTTELFFMSKTYLTYMLMFTPFLMIALVMDCFVRIDNRPFLAFIALFLSALINIILDYYLIVYLEKGVWGAAIATGISQVFVLIILLPHYFSKKANIKFVKPKGSFYFLFKSILNGVSEFLNESSIAITTIIFNYIMLKNFGVDGLAAYSVISYILLISVMLSFGISDSLTPLISKNFGAKKNKRINEFLKYAFISVSITSLILLNIVLFFPEMLANIFLDIKDLSSISLAITFFAFIWPVFIFSSFNIVISSYFTATHKSFYSSLIAILRSLILPILFIFILPIFLGDIGIYISILCSEFVTFIFAIYYFRKINKT